MDAQLRKEFLTNTDHTGRFFVHSIRTGKIYAVEPMGDPHKKWGDVGSSYDGMSGDYGKKYRGSIDPEESLITEENGFKNIQTIGPGTSPMAAVEFMDSKYPDKVMDLT